MKKTFSKSKLKKAMDSRNMKPTEFTFRLQQCGEEVSLQTVLNWLSGATVPRSNSLQASSQVLNYKMEYFFDFESKQNI